jgi:hypothetical protein
VRPGPFSPGADFPLTQSAAVLVFLLLARVGAFACVFAAATCFAQTPEEVRRDAQMHLGPFYVTPRFAVEEFGVDTNVFHSADAKRDFTFTIAPGAAVQVPFGRRAVVTTNATSDVVYYQRYGSERSINPDVTLRTEFFLGRVEPFLEAGYLRSRQRPNFEIDARSLRRERPSRFGLRVRASAKTTFEVASDRRSVEFAADASFNNVHLQETLNRVTRRTSVETRYEATPLTTVFVRTESTTDRFEFSPLRDADSFAVVPGVQFKARALVSGSARVGFRRFTPVNDGLAPFSGTVASASLSYTLQGVTRFTVTADRDLTYSYERLQPYYVVDGIGLAVRRQVVGAIDISASIQRQQYSYRDLLLPGASATDLNRIDTVHGWSAGVGYRLGNSMRAGIGLTFRERASSSARLRDYQGTRFITTLDYEL